MSSIPPYSEIEFPEPQESRPYTFINMVATIDGKTVSATRNDPVQDIGSKMDHQMMKLIESKAEAILIGARTVRAHPNIRYPQGVRRITVSSGFDFDFGTRFFADDPDRVIVITPGDAAAVPAGFKGTHITLSQGGWVGVFKTLRQDFKIRYLLCEGGSELNAQLLREDLVDELFLTLAPKIKLGADLPTYAGGDPLPPGFMHQYHLINCSVYEDEVFLRYQRSWER